jgi:uncharacterized protein (DUF2141 family)
MNKIGMLLISMLFLSLAVVIKPVAGGATVVKVDPSLIEYHENATGQQFTVSIKIVDVTNLYGFDIQFRWNTTFLSYVSRSVYVPRNASSPDGVLWNQTYPVEDQVNTTAGTYWVAYASIWPAFTFNGTGTVFNMTFQIISQPVQPQPDANITLQLYSTELSNNIGGPILHTRQNGTVILYALSGGSHDVAVTNLTSAKTVIGQGYCGNLTVTVQNQGNSPETFNVTAYANTTSVASQNVTLSSGTSTTLTFTWNTTGFVKGNYTISAAAEILPGETDTTDNDLTDGWVTVTILGDVNGDFKCDGKDITMTAKAYGSYVGQARYVPNADINDDGKVDGKDITVAAKHYGTHYP